MIQVKIIREAKSEQLEKTLNTYLKDNSKVGNNLKDIKLTYDSGNNLFLALVLFENTKTWESNSD